MSFLRYIATQFAAYGIDMGLFICIVYLFGTDPVIANVFAKSAAGIFAFFVHRRFTFRMNKSDHKSDQICRYFVLLLINVPLASLALWLILFLIEPPVIAKLLSDVGMLVFNFWLSKHWVFVTNMDLDTPQNANSVTDDE